MNGIVKNKNGNEEGIYCNRSKSPNLIMNESFDSIYGNSNSNSLKKSPNRSWKAKQRKEIRSEDLNLKVSDNYHVGDLKGDVNKNVSSTTGAYTCPSVGICQMHMRDAAKCHLS